MSPAADKAAQTADLPDNSANGMPRSARHPRQPGQRLFPTELRAIRDMRKNQL